MPLLKSIFVLPKSLAKQLNFEKKNTFRLGAAWPKKLLIVSLVHASSFIKIKKNDGGARASLRTSGTMTSPSNVIG